MSEKVNVSHKVAEAYQELLDKHEGNSLAVVYEWSEKILPHKTDSVLKDVDWFTLLALMTGGYELIEGTPEEEIAKSEVVRLRKALEKIMEVEAPIAAGWETSAYKIARQALGGEVK